MFFYEDIPIVLNGQKANSDKAENDKILKNKNLIEALRAGTNKVHMVDGRVKHTLLLEIYTDSGVGTQIIKD